MPVTEDEVQSWMRSLYEGFATADGKRSFLDYLSIAREQQSSQEFKSILDTINSIVSLGYPLSKAMSFHPEVFSSSHIAVVRYGEMYGELCLTLQRYVERPEDRLPRCGVSRTA